MNASRCRSKTCDPSAFDTRMYFSLAVRGRLTYGTEWLVGIRDKDLEALLYLLVGHW
jgi:hypothetical protein